jgi:hypothetical protein
MRNVYELSKRSAWLAVGSDSSLASGDAVTAEVDGVHPEADVGMGLTVLTSSPEL